MLSFCCQVNHDSVAKCLLEGGCGEKEEPCPLLIVKLPYFKAGILTASDSLIKKKLLALWEEYCLMNKLRNKSSKEKEEKYMNKIQKTFDIRDPNARKVIENDPVRSETARKQDLAFYDDYFGPEAKRSKWSMGSRDKQFDRDILSSLLSSQALENRRIERQNRQNAREEKEKKEKETRMEKIDLHENFPDEEPENLRKRKADGDDGSDWEKEHELPEKGKKRKMSGRGKGRKAAARREEREDGGGGGDGDCDVHVDDEDGVWLKVPRNILKITSLTATRRGMSHGDHYSILAAFLRGSNADLDDFTLSHSSSNRMRKEATEEVYNMSREKFREKAAEEDWPLTLHFDEKTLEDRIGPDGARSFKKTPRLAVTLTCPMLRESFWCVPLPWRTRLAGKQQRRLLQQWWSWG